MNGGLIGLSTSFGKEEKKHSPARMFVLTTMGGIGAELSAFSGEIPEWSHNGWYLALRDRPVPRQRVLEQQICASFTNEFDIVFDKLRSVSRRIDFF
jgi:hypothetical protein